MFKISHVFTPVCQIFRLSSCREIRQTVGWTVIKAIFSAFRPIKKTIFIKNKGKHVKVEQLLSIL